MRGEAARGGTHLAAKKVGRFEARYQELIEAGLEANPPPERTGKRGRPKPNEGQELGGPVGQAPPLGGQVHARPYRVPFDNNRAERDLRMVKVRQKISGCSCTTIEGAAAFLRIRGYIFSTAGKQAENVLAALEGAFREYPFVPTLQG